MTHFSLKKDFCAYLLIGAFVALAIAGCGGGGGGSSSGGDNTPGISVPKVSNIELPASGGPITIEADVITSAGVQNVTATITRPDNSKVIKSMTLKSGSTYQCTYTPTANTNTNGTGQIYSVVITALDLANTTFTSNTRTFTVDAPLQVNNPTATPTIVSYDYTGTITISADIIGTAVKEVKAHISLNGGSEEIQTMLPTSAPTYTFVKSQLSKSTTTDQKYQVYIVAKDNAGQTKTSSTFSFTVRAKDSDTPPPPPF